MIVLSHPTGNENVRQAALAFAEANLLREFWTTLNWNPESIFDKTVPDKLRRTFRRRAYPEVVRRRIRSLPLREAARLLLGGAKVPLFSRHETGWLSIDAISRALDRKVALEMGQTAKFTTVYGYEDCAFETFTAAQRRGFSRIYDLPIGYWRTGQRIFAEEREREPEWAATLTGTDDSEEKLARKDEELRLANHVIVASTFTRLTLAESPHSREVSVIPYGAPPTDDSELLNSPDKLRILFAGSLGQRKGLSYALRAVELLGREHCELTLLGRKAVSGCRILDDAVREHRWIPSVSHREMLSQMRAHDVLLFPSLFEGFGLVITEALSQGTPVITTANTGGPDVIYNGMDGFIVPIRSPEAIAEKLEVLAREPYRAYEMKLAARTRARTRTWENYRRQLVALAREVMNT
jgi:glycosyltransferase involved in cell wall biosynthesis